MKSFTASILLAVALPALAKNCVQPIIRNGANDPVYVILGTDGLICDDIRMEELRNEVIGAFSYEPYAIKRIAFKYLDESASGEADAYRGPGVGELGSGDREPTSTSSDSGNSDALEIMYYSEIDTANDLSALVSFSLPDFLENPVSFPIRSAFHGQNLNLAVPFHHQTLTDPRFQYFETELSVMLRLSASLREISFQETADGAFNLLLLDLDETVFSPSIAAVPILLDLFLPQALATLKRQHENLRIFGLTARDIMVAAETRATLSDLGVALDDVIFTTENGLQHTKGAKFIEYLNDRRLPVGFVHFFDDQPRYLLSVSDHINKAIDAKNALFDGFTGLHLHYSVATFFFMRSGFEVVDFGHLQVRVDLCKTDSAMHSMNLFITKNTLRDHLEPIAELGEAASPVILRTNDPAFILSTLKNRATTESNTLVFDSFLSAYFAQKFLLETGKLERGKSNFHFGVLTDPRNPTIFFDDAERPIGWETLEAASVSKKIN
jgi:hypothetical protein